MSALERDPANRPQNAIALGRVLAPFGSGRIDFEALADALPPPAVGPSSRRASSLKRSDPSASISKNDQTASAWSHGPPSRTRRSMVFVVVALATAALTASVAVGIWRSRLLGRTVAESPPAPATVSAPTVVPPPSAPSDAPPAVAASVSTPPIATAQKPKTVAPPPPPPVGRPPPGKPPPPPASSAKVDPLHL
jgi:hypothetical protein